MKLYNEPMANHTTFKIGGPADVMVIPESEEELIKTVKECKENNTPFYILGNGSNILVNDEGIRGIVIKNTQACREVDVKNNIVEVGSSVYLQDFVRVCINHNLEGMEYLYSVPATVGGALFMNAGTRRKVNQQIGDNVLQVKIFDGEVIRKVDREDCAFGYRHSVFQNRKEWIILGATFALTQQDCTVGKQKIKDRVSDVIRRHDLDYPNVGSIFKNGNYVIVRLIRGLRCGDAQFSKKTPNWIINRGKAKSRDVIKLIQYAKWLHFLVFKIIKLEIKIW